MKIHFFRAGKFPFLTIWLFSTLASGLNAADSPAAGSTDTSQTNSEALAVYKKMSLDELMNQEVTSVSKQPEPLREAPAEIQVITGEDIRRSGASSIPEALRLASDLNVAQQTSSQWDISARGFNTSGFSDKLLVLMDGRSLYTPLLAGVIWNMQDYLLADIDRIEVISGPGGTLWGANAVNGVINITSKNAKDTQGLYVEGGGGSSLQDFGGIRYGGIITSNIYYRVYGKYFDRDSEVYPDGKSAHDWWNRGQGGFRIDANASDQDQFTLQGDIFGGDNDSTPGGEGTPTAEGTSGGGDILGRWKHTFAEDSDLSLQLYYDRTHLGAPFQSSGAIPAGTLKDDLDTYDLDFQDRFPLGTWNRIVWGWGYRFTHDVVQAAPLVTFLPNTLGQNLYSGFVQDEIKLHDDVFLTAGTKVEHNDYTGFEFEPSVRLQWNVTSNQMVWGAISRAVRTPSRYDRDLAEPSPAYGTFLMANSGFESETVIAYELGYRAQLSRNISGSLSAFYNDYDDLRSLSLTPGTIVPLYWSNNVKGDSYGFELSVDYQVLDWWRLRGGYDLLKETIWVKPGQTDLYNALGETADPENQVFLRSSMDLPGRTELDAGFRWIDTVHNNNGGVAGTVPAYAEMDVRLAWHATKNLEFSIVGQNLLHDQHAEAGYAGPSQQPPTQEEIVRSVFGKVTWQF
ncbi:MAG TPA: TonB-dependent receptor [Verrucomicrobiae bacterium]|nr:TonB-dependent receptor [Verrucomicrobiae bacterium]